MRLGLAAFLALALAGCGAIGGPESYAMSPSEMQARLAASELPLDALGSGDYGLQSRTTKLGDGSLSWIIMSKGHRDLIHIRVTISEAGSGSQFAVEVTGATPAAEQGLVENPSFRSHFLEFAKEHCDAVLDGRSFDALAVDARTQRPNAEENARTARAMNAAGAAYQRREAANIQKAYREEPSRNPWQ